MALNKEASFGYRRMVEAEQAWAASFRDAEVYEMGPEREHYGERLPCRRRVILARDSEIPDMSGMMAARDYYADVMGVIESGKLKTSGPGSRGASSVMRYAPGAPGNRAPLLQDDDIGEYRKVWAIMQPFRFRTKVSTPDAIARTWRAGCHRGLWFGFAA